MAWLLENVGFVEPEGETMQILSRSKSVVPSRALLIQLWVAMNKHENQSVDMP